MRIQTTTTMAGMITRQRKRHWISFVLTSSSGRALQLPRGAVAEVELCGWKDHQQGHRQMLGHSVKKSFHLSDISFGMNKGIAMLGMPKKVLLGSFSLSSCIFIESARAFTGRRCPHSGKGEDFLSHQPNFFTETAVTPERKVEKWFPRWEINRHAEG